MKQTAITLDPFLTSTNILGCNITPVPPLYLSKENRLASILTSKFKFLSNRACWPLEVTAILQTISRLLNCIYRQLISGQTEKNYQGNNKPHEISTWSSIPFPSPAKFPRRQAGSRAALLNGQVVVTGGHAGTTSIGRYTDEVLCFSLIWCHYPGKLISAILSRCWFISRCISTT